MPKPRPDDTGHDLTWDREKFGRMADYATADDAVQTVADGDETGDDPDAA